MHIYFHVPKVMNVGQIYSISQVVQGRAAHPKVWAGRTVLVRGQVGWVATGGASGARQAINPLYPPPGVIEHIVLVPPVDSNMAPKRPVVMLQLLVLPRLTKPAPTLAPLQDFLLRLPLVGKFFSSPQRLDGMHTFRVRLLPMHAPNCTNCGSIDALLEEVKGP